MQEPKNWLNKILKMVVVGLAAIYSFCVMAVLVNLLSNSLKAEPLLAVFLLSLSLLFVGLSRLPFNKFGLIGLIGFGSLLLIITGFLLFPINSAYPDWVKNLQEKGERKNISEVDECVKIVNSRNLIPYAITTPIPNNAIIVTSFDGYIGPGGDGATGKHYTDFPVKPICYYGDYGVFVSTKGFIAPYKGAYISLA